MAAIMYLVLVATVLASVLAHDIPEDARKACGHIKEADECYTDCVYRFYGILENGRYVEGKAADALLLLHKGEFNQDQVNKITKNCNILNEQKPAEGCKRAGQVFDCISEEKYKITGKRS